MLKRVAIIVATAWVALGAWAEEPCFSPERLDGANAAELVECAARCGKLRELLEAAEERFFAPLSPAYSEERMAEFLRPALASGKLSDDEADTAEWMLHEVCEVNAPDSLAADFQFELADGSASTLSHYLPGRPLALVFYDPDCRHCQSVMAELAGLAEVVDVLAVCVDSPVKRWVQTRTGLNPGWVPAYDLSDIQANDTYVLRGLPGLYLLDGERRVVLKNPSPERLLERAKGGAGK